MFKEFSERLRGGEQLVGTIVSLDNAAVAEILSHCGFDWLFVDAEHGALSIGAIEKLVRAGSPIPSLVRIVDRSEVAVKQALEVGAAGIIVPQVNDEQTARTVVSYAKYPPAGVRGVGVGRANTHGMAFKEYLASANAQISVVVQIEHATAVENVESILAVEGVDAVLVGPNDLAASMGLLGQTEHKDVLGAIDKVSAACRRAGKPAGIFQGQVAHALRAKKQGFSLIACGIDTMFLGSGASQLAAELKQT